MIPITPPTPNVETLGPGRKGQCGRSGYSLVKTFPEGCTDLWPSLCSRPLWRREQTEQRIRKSRQRLLAGRSRGRRQKGENPIFSSYGISLLSHPLEYPVEDINHLHSTREKTGARQGPQIIHKQSVRPTGYPYALLVLGIREN